MGRQVPAHPRIVDRDLRCDSDSVERLRYRRQPSVRDAVQRRLQQRRTRNRQPAKQIRRGVGGLDRLGDDPVHRAGVQRRFDLERGRAGDGIARRDRRLYRRRTTPRRQQREVQVDPPVRGHGEQAVTKQRPVGHHRTYLWRQFAPTPRRIRRSWGGRVAARGYRARERVARRVTATVYPAGPRPHLGA